MRDDSAKPFTDQHPGIKHGIGGGQWESSLDFKAKERSGPSGRDDDHMKYRMVGSSSSVGMDQLTAIHVYSNGYKILEVPEAEFKVDDTAFDPEIPVKFTPEELSDKWVRIRPRDASAFQISFSDQTPKKMFEPRLTPDSLASRRKGTIGESREAGARLQGAQEHAGRVP